MHCYSFRYDCSFSSLHQRSTSDDLLDSQLGENGVNRGQVDFLGLFRSDVGDFEVVNDHGELESTISTWQSQTCVSEETRSRSTCPKANSTH